jgi:hypothetical protein
MCCILVQAMMLEKTNREQQKKKLDDSAGACNVFWVLAVAGRGGK